MIQEDWYKDAIIYELHVKTFYDSNGDGYGDFRGLIQKLDYLSDLGVNCLWLLPFYESPLKDDGYDIADYRKILSAYGTREDFQEFVDQAHARGMRILIELVLNHTSDRHAWFEDSRTSKTSKYRDWYVWRDSPDVYSNVRIIFNDTEKSNWAYDQASGQYYWHRFFSHQPDLNYENPEVQKEMADILSFWLKTGVDGFRLDAVSYLFEREGTACENLPETHAYLKHLRSQMDKQFPEKIFLAEANQFPEGVRPYFGNGDECHMAFYFPLMPRIFMAIRKENSFPIIEIINQTPALPANCQWALFLRNHDELTLEMVSEEDRSYMFHEFAANPQAKLNLGIRRRLAPLMNNGRRQMELLNSLLFSLPGTPIIYYGDEIGMGDNIYLGDRNGVRTPMQWNRDRNAGFSSADAEKLCTPLVSDPVYGYQSVNVEAQQSTQSSLLNWTKRMIRVRKAHPAFGRGGLEFLIHNNPSVLAFTRSDENETLLIVNNLSRYVQPVRLDLQKYCGSSLTELWGNVPFPIIENRPYFLSLGPHSFYWFQLNLECGDKK